MAGGRKGKRKVNSKKEGGKYSQSAILSRLSRGTGPSIRGLEQEITTLVVPGLPHLLTNTVTTGVLQFVLKLDPLSDIENFSTRQGADYEEVRCLVAMVKVIPCQQTQGLSAVWIDEKYSNTPILSEAQGKSVSWCVHNNAGKAGYLTCSWTPNDVADMAFVNATAGSIGNAAYFKLYTNNTNFNAPIAATSLFLVQVHYLLELRGIQE
jgi:hypothetical protein